MRYLIQLSDSITITEGGVKSCDLLCVSVCVHPRVCEDLFDPSFCLLRSPWSLKLNRDLLNLVFSTWVLYFNMRPKDVFHDDLHIHGLHFSVPLISVLRPSVGRFVFTGRLHVVFLVCLPVREVRKRWDGKPGSIWARKIEVRHGPRRSRTRTQFLCPLRTIVGPLFLVSRSLGLWVVRQFHLRKPIKE